MDRPHATRLAYRDEVLATLPLPAAPLVVCRGIGSGLARVPGDPPGVFWAIGDRGPNFKVKVAVERYGLDHLAAHRDIDGAKVMPCPDIGPALSQLRLDGDGVILLRSLPLRDSGGSPLSGFPLPGDGAHEPALALDGSRIAPDPGGADPEGVAWLGDHFVVGDEYGPSLLHVDRDGSVLARWVPHGTGDDLAGAPYPIVEALPAIAAHRRLNRGFEALAASADGGHLFLAFQSPLAHPDDAAHERARHVRLWQLDARTGALIAEYLYPLDPPESFARDVALGGFEQSDIKVSELAVLAPDRLLVLERGSATTKLYAVALDPALALDPACRDVEARPTVEQRSAAGEPLPSLAKRLVLTTDDLPEVGADLEGMILLDERTLLLVNDNDFGVEGVATGFWRVDLPVPLF